MMTRDIDTLMDQLVQAVVDEVDPEQVILFGSRARGDERENSDIDLIVIFIDPYFHPDQQRYRRPFEAFLERIVHPRPCEPPNRVEVHTATNHDWTEEYFRGKCESRLPRCIPAGIPVLVRQLSQKPQGEKLHNRYILTDLGGIAFGTGLDEGGAGETDDVTLMDREQYDKRWSQYGGNPPVSFNQDRSPIEVVGIRRLPQQS